jgi:hypothetical protein
MNPRRFIQTTVFAVLATSLQAAEERRPRILLRSSWQTVNIGDIAHTPGMLALLEKHRPDAEITLWPSSVGRGVEELLRTRFPKLRIAKSKAERETALAECDFFLHGSGPGLVGWKEAKLAQQAGKPYGFGGITLNDGEIKDQRELLAGAKFVFLRDTDSLHVWVPNSRFMRRWAVQIDPGNDSASGNGQGSRTLGLDFHLSLRASPRPRIDERAVHYNSAGNALAFG